jgi:hypothetical protein
LAYEPLEQRTVLSVVLDGDVLDLGVHDDGSLVTAPSYTGGVGASLNGVECLTWGTPWAFLSVSANGETYTNAGPLWSPSPFAVNVTDTSSDGTLSVLVEGTVTSGLELERTISFASHGSLARCTITLSNTGSATLENVAFLEGLDPDPGYAFGQAYVSYNDVVLGGSFVRANAVEDGSPGLTIGLGSTDPRATVSVELWQPDPVETLDSPVDPDGALQDHHIHLAFDFGTLAAGESVSAEYALVLAATPSEADDLYLSASNAPPVASDDCYTVDEDNTLSVAALGVLLNDHDPDGDPLAATKVTDPTNGTLCLDRDGSFTYTPNADFYGTDRFVYEVSDGQGGTDTATVTITVNPVIDALIDIRPGSDKNRINLRSKGRLPVAILTTHRADGEPDDFDANSLAGLSRDHFEFGDSRAGFARVHPRRMVVEDVDGDGDLDLLLKYSMRAIRRTGALAADSVDAVLSVEYGREAAGAHLVAHDAVHVKVPRGKGKRGK